MSTEALEFFRKIEPLQRAYAQGRAEALAKVESAVLAARITDESSARVDAWNDALDLILAALSSLRDDAS